MNENEYFDVPFCRVEESSVCFPKTNDLKDAKLNNNLTTTPITLQNNQVKDRPKYNNKLVKQLKAAGFNVEEESGHQVITQSSSHGLSSDYYSDQESKTQFDKKLVNLAEQTLNALDNKKMNSDEELDSWDPMKDSYEQKSFNSYKEPSYDADVTEKHNPVRGTRISPAKGSQDEVTLYIKNIPLSLTEEGMRNMFSTCGRCRRVKKCKPKFNTDTTFGFVAYSSVKEAEEAITKYDHFRFGRDSELRVQLSREKEKGLGFIPQNIDIQLGPKYNNKPNDNTDSGMDSIENEPPSTNTLQKNLSSKEAMTSQDEEKNRQELFSHMFSNGSQKNNDISCEVKTGPRLYIQGIPTYWNEGKLQDIIDEIAPCKMAKICPAKTKNQFTTFGFVTVGSVEDADKIIEHFTSFSQNKIKVSYSSKSAQNYNKTVTSNDNDADDFYLNLISNPSYDDDEFFQELPQSDLVKEPLVANNMEILEASSVFNVSKTCNINEETIVQHSEMDDTHISQHSGEAENVNIPSFQFEEDSESSLLRDMDYNQVEDSFSEELATSLPGIGKNSYVPIMRNQITKKKISSNIDDAKQKNYFIDDLNQPVIKLPENPTPIDEKEIQQNDDHKKESVNSQIKTDLTPASKCSFIRSTLPDFAFPLEFALSKMNVQNLYSDYYVVKITHVESPFLIYGHLLQKDGKSETEILSEELLKFFSVERELTFEFRAGKFCVVHVQGAWKRGIIKSVDEASVNVFLLDFGNEVQCSYKQLLPLVQKFKNPAAQALPMKLITVKPINNQEEWSDETCNFLRETLINKRVRVRPEHKEKMVFGVRIKIDSQSLDLLLKEKGLAEQVQCELPQLVVNWNPFYYEKKHNLSVVMSLETPSATEFEVYVANVVSPRLFYSRLLTESKDLKVDEIEKELSNDCNKTQQNVTLSEGDLCAVELENDNWHRGFIFKINKDVCKVNLVDYGRICNVPLSSLYTLPEKLKEFPAQGIRMQLQYVVPLDNSGYSSNACERFKDLTAGRVMIVNVCNVHESIYRVKLIDKLTGVNVGEKLIEEGFAQALSYQHPSSFRPPNYSQNAPSRVSSTVYDEKPRRNSGTREDTTELKPPKDHLKRPVVGKGRGLVIGRGLALLKEHGLLQKR